MRILVIEDDAFLRKAYEVGLRHQGFDVNLASDGEMGLRMAEEIRPDAIVLDVLLPKLSGVEVLQRLKGNPSLRNIKVIVFSVSCDEEEFRAILRLGADGYCSKSGTDLNQLGQTIRSLCARNI